MREKLADSGGVRQPCALRVSYVLDTAGAVSCTLTLSSSLWFGSSGSGGGGWGMERCNEVKRLAGRHMHTHTCVHIYT